MNKINLNKPRKEWTDEEWDAYDELHSKKMLQLIEETRERESRKINEKIEQDIRRIKSKPLVEASEENLNRFYNFYFEHGIINEDLLKDDIEIKKEIQDEP